MVLSHPAEPLLRGAAAGGADRARGGRRIASHPGDRAPRRDAGSQGAAPRAAACAAGVDAGAARGVRVEARRGPVVRGDRRPHRRLGALAQDADAPGLRPAPGTIEGRDLTWRLAIIPWWNGCSTASALLP